MSEPGRLVDWGLAERAAGVVIGGIGAPAPSPAVGGYDRQAVESACAESRELAASHAGLGPAPATPEAELVDRREWARTALATLADASRPIEERLHAELALPGPLAPLARSLAGAAGAAEAGVAVGYAARRVLGQYDVALFGAERPARLLFVAENLSAARRELDADPELFLRWIALHETTHVIQFQSVNWLSPYLRGLADELVAGAAAGLDPSDLAGLARRLLREPRAVVRAALRGDLARALAAPAQRATLDRLQAVMSVIEGHAEHVMDVAAAELGPGVAELRRRLDRRRARRSGLGDVIGRLLGMDLKLRQYELGKAFCDAVAEAGGEDSLRHVWDSAEGLPDLAELEDPVGWLDRMGAFSRLPA